VRALPTPDEIARLRQLDRDHLLHPNVVLGEFEEAGGTVIVGGEGATVRDIEGREYIDAIGALWLANVGYGRRELADVAAAQMRQLPFWSLFYGWGNEPAIRLAAELARIAPAGFRHAFFTSGGSEANETSIKFARLYHVRRGNPGKRIVIGLQRAYHGVSYGAMTATGLERVREGYAPLVGAFEHIPGAYCYRCPFGKTYPECQVDCADELERAIGRLGAENVAAFIAEPIQGVGGVITPPAGYYEKVRAICDRHDVLWIADEVICGFGRTGRLFGVEHWTVRPDLISCAKGITSGYMPLGASLVSDKVYAALRGDGHQPLNHGFTYSGHPVACAVALENIRILQREGLPARAAELGESLRAQILALGNPYIGEVRGKGLLVGVELVRDRGSREPADVAAAVELACRRDGVILRALGGNIISISPPLVITPAQITRVVATLDQAVRAVCGGLGREGQVTP
jgi:putrescine aminotransferase